jgi:hypothetical protein
MARISDTTPEAEQFFRELLRKMTFEQKWREMSALYHLGKEIHVLGVRARCPDATPEQVHADWIRRCGLKDAPPPPRGDPFMFGGQEANIVVEHVVRVLEQLHIVYAIAGSWASSIYGKMRFTYDVDICVEPFAGKEEAFCSALGDDYYVSLDAVRQAIRERRSFNVIYTLTAFKVDLFVARPRLFDQSVLKRRQVRRLGAPHAIDVATVSAEDVILLKMEWYRLGDESSAQQWQDILGVFQTQGEALDQGYLATWAEALGVADLLERAREELAE